MFCCHELIEKLVIGCLQVERSEWCAECGVHQYSAFQQSGLFALVGCFPLLDRKVVSSGLHRCSKSLKNEVCRDQKGQNNCFLKVDLLKEVFELKKRERNEV